jgi:Domain of unknown function (DUF4832)
MVHLNALAVAATLCLSIAAASSGAQQRVRMEYRPAPIDNPLKGLVPYAGDHREEFPHSMEFSYIALSQLMKGENTYDWTALESLLDRVAARGHQTVFRVFLEFPGKIEGIPEFLKNGNLKITKVLNTNTQPFPAASVEVPDYSFPVLRRCLQNFIAELGKKYDGDPRIGFITAGLLGTWGEWHDFPHDELFAPKTVQIEVMRAYTAAFKITPVLLRYPAGESDYMYASNRGRPFGYHDDSFAWATLDTGKKEENWFYLAKLKAAGPGAQNKWKKWPIGGEIRPEAWGKVFDAHPDVKEIQDFDTCVKETHVSWLMDSGMFRMPMPEARKTRALAMVGKMGYEFSIRNLETRLKGKHLEALTEIVNTGVAPFYYSWKAEFALLNPANGSVVKQFSSENSLVGILPGARSKTWKDALDLSDVAPGSYLLVLRVPNSLKNAPPVKFANAAQDKDADGWLTLTTVELK